MILRKRGFTLIELLVVIAIIAILAAILFPVFTKAKEKTKATRCANNAGQLGKGFSMYADDFNGRYPSAGEGSASTTPGDCHLFRALSKYIGGNKNLFICPADTGDKLLGGSATPYHSLTWRSSWAWPVGWGPWIDGCLVENPSATPNRNRDYHRVPISKRPVIFDHRPWHWGTEGTTWTDIKGKNTVLWADGHVSNSDHNTMLWFMGVNQNRPPGF